jgi:hypothetical protein
MSYFAKATYDAIRSDPSKVVSIYAATRGKFISDLGATGAGLSEDLIKAAWCTMVAYGLTPYGPNPPRDTNLTTLLALPTMACAAYVSVTWGLLDKLGVSTAKQTALGWDDGAVGNHAQMLMADQGQSLLLDPTIGLIVKGVTYDGLVGGTKYTTLSSFYSRTDISSFNALVLDAVTGGKFRLRDAIYVMPGFESWTTQYDTLLHSGVRLQNSDGSIRMAGSLFADTMQGTDLADTLYGGKGNDTIKGGSGNDVIEGGKGNDRLVGGAGWDTLTGGAGADVFEFDDMSDLGIASSRSDLITDFSPLQGDKIDISAIDANELTIGDQAFSFVGSRSYFTGVGQACYTYNAAVNETWLMLNTDADPYLDGIIRLVGNVKLTSTDVITGSGLLNVDKDPILEHLGLTLTATKNGIDQGDTISVQKGDQITFSVNLTGASNGVSKDLRVFIAPSGQGVGSVLWTTDLNSAPTYGIVNAAAKWLPNVKGYYVTIPKGETHATFNATVVKDFANGAARDFKIVDYLYSSPVGWYSDYQLTPKLEIQNGGDPKETLQWTPSLQSLDISRLTQAIASFGASTGTGLVTAAATLSQTHEQLLAAAHHG